MLYKIHKEPLEVGTAVRSLISVILYNVYNVMEWAPYRAIRHHTAQERQKTGCKFAARQPVNG